MHFLPVPLCPPKLECVDCYCLTPACRSVVNTCPFYVRPRSRGDRSYWSCSSRRSSLLSCCTSYTYLSCPCRPCKPCPPVTNVKRERLSDFLATVPAKQEPSRSKTLKEGSKGSKSNYGKNVSGKQSPAKNPSSKNHGKRVPKADKGKGGKKPGGKKSDTKVTLGTASPQDDPTAGSKVGSTPGSKLDDKSKGALGLTTSNQMESKSGGSIGKPTAGKKGKGPSRPSSTTKPGRPSSGTKPGRPSSGTNAGRPSSGTNAGRPSSGTNAGRPSSGTNAGGLSSGTNAGKPLSGTNAGRPSSGTNAGRPPSGTNAGRPSSGTNAGRPSSAINYDRPPSVSRDGPSKAKCFCQLDDLPMLDQNERSKQIYDLCKKYIQAFDNTSKEAAVCTPWETHDAGMSTECLTITKEQQTTECSCARRKNKYSQITLTSPAATSTSPSPTQTIKKFCRKCRQTYTNTFGEVKERRKRSKTCCKCIGVNNGNVEYSLSGQINSTNRELWCQRAEHRLMYDTNSPSLTDSICYNRNKDILTIQNKYGQQMSYHMHDFVKGKYSCSKGKCNCSRDFQ